MNGGKQEEKANVFEKQLKRKKKRKRIQEDEGRDCEKVFDIFQCYA